MKVYWAVGHGITKIGVDDSGAKGGGQTEQTAGDIVVKSGADTMRSWGVEVRDESYSNDPNFQGTDDLVRAWGADLLVSVHHDWVGDPPGSTPPGFFALWYRANGRALGEAIEAAVARAGFAIRPYPADGYRSDLSILKTVGAIPNVLLECGRIGQYTPEQLRRLGVAIAYGIADYAGIRTTTQEDTMTPEQEARIMSKLDAMQADIDRSQRADAIRSAMIATRLRPASDAADARFAELAASAKAAGIVTGFE
jgi:hypothetical protein